MSDINDKILKAMQDEQASQSDINEADANAIDLIKESFRGKFKLTFIFVVSMQVLLAAFAIYAGYQLLHIDDVANKIEWAVAIIISVVVFAIARIYFFLELNRLSVLRELKRVELQMALLLDTKRS